MSSSQKNQEASAADPVLQVVSFDLGHEVFAIDILQVQEIIRPLEITQIPNAPDSVEGVINLRGKVIPIVDLRKKFNLPVKEDNLQERIIVIKGVNKPVGMIVDSVSDVLRFNKTAVEPASSISASIDSRSIAGVAKLKDQLLILLDVENLLAHAEQSALS